jgi:ABC-type cobalamin/Fe3+-siderophores transport system ATPase subunit
MTQITFNDVSFAYPSEEAFLDEDTPNREESGGAPGADRGAPEERAASEADRGASDEPATLAAPTEPLFSHLTLSLPGGFTFVVGPNGIGKSTLMLLAGARIFPQGGHVTIGGRDTHEFENAGFEPELEQERNELVSFVYQNMEFETDQPIGEVLELVAQNGVDPNAAAGRLDELVAAADLTDRLSVRMHELSKGEMQRGIVAMSVLYGSPVIMMDEPIFAVEPTRGERLFEWLAAYCRETGTDIYTSVHDVKMAEQFAHHVVLMHTDGTIDIGDPKELLSRESLETAFRAPYDTLYQRQNLYRELLNKSFS